MNLTFFKNKINKLRILIFLLCLSFYLGLSGPHVYSDGILYYTLTEDAAINHSLMFRLGLPSQDIIESKNNLQEYMSGSYYLQGKSYDPSNPQPINASMLPILLSLVGVPFYYLSQIFHLQPTFFVPLIVNPIITAFTSVIIFSFGYRLFNSEKIGVVLALLFGITSFVVPWTSEYLTRSLSALMLISAIYFIYMTREDKRPIYAMVGGIFTIAIAMAQEAQYLSIIIILGFATIWLRKNKKLLLYFIIGALFVILIQGYLNAIRFGSPTDFGISHSSYGIKENLTWWSYEGLYGFWISPGFGLPFYYPISILLPISLYFLFRRNWKIAVLFSAIIIAEWIHSSQTSQWTGYGTWGPRYLIPILPVITLATGSIIKKSKIFSIPIIFAALTGFVINLLGKLIWYPISFTPLWLYNYANNKPFDIEVLIWNPHWSPILNDLKIATSNWVTDHWHPGPHQYDYGHYLNQMYPNCEYNLFFYCNYGILPIIITASVIAIISYLILRTLKNVTVSEVENKV